MRTLRAGRLILLLLLFSLGSPAFAQIGKDLKACKAKFGKLAHADLAAKQFEFEYENFAIKITMLKGKAARITYRRIYTVQEKKDRKKLTDEDILKLLRENSDNEWIEGAAFSSHRLWRTSDGSASAHYSELSQTLLISTEAYSTWELQGRDPAEKEEPPKTKPSPEKKS